MTLPLQLARMLHTTARTGRTPAGHWAAYERDLWMPYLQHRAAGEASAHLKGIPPDPALLAAAAAYVQPSPWGPTRWDSPMPYPLRYAAEEFARISTLLGQLRSSCPGVGTWEFNHARAQLLAATGDVVCAASYHLGPGHLAFVRQLDPGEQVSETNTIAASIGAIARTAARARTYASVLTVDQPVHWPHIGAWNAAVYGVEYAAVALGAGVVAAADLLGRIDDGPDFAQFEWTAGQAVGAVRQAQQQLNTALP